MTRITSTKKVYTTRNLARSGHGGPTGWVRWEVSSVELLSQDEVEEVIESLFPFAGYGSSTFRRLTKLEGRPYEIEVMSNASAD